MTVRRNELPRFKYHPDPIGTHVIVRRDSVCPCCNAVRGFAYDGPSFSIANVEDLCPWCIASGEAARKFDLYFVYDYDLEQVTSPEKKDELQHRTPGYFFGSDYFWPVHCGDYCAVLRKVLWPDIAPIVAELDSDLNVLQKDGGMSRDEIIEELHGTALWSYLFQCVHCGTHRLAASYE